MKANRFLYLENPVGLPLYQLNDSVVNYAGAGVYVFGSNDTFNNFLLVTYLAGISIVNGGGS